MVEDLTVLLVGDDEPDEKLVEQLEKKNLAVEISSKKEFPSLLALVEPHIVIHTGKEGAERTASILKETEEVRRVRLVVLAPRDELSELRQLDKTVVVSLLATDIAPSVVAARVLMLAKKGPDKSGRPQSIAAKPPAREPAKAPGAPPSLPKAAPFTKPVAPPKPIIAEAKPPERPPVPSLGARPEGVKPPLAPKPALGGPPRAVSTKPKPEPQPPVVREKAPPKEMEREEAPTSTAPPSSQAPPSEFPTVAVQAETLASAIERTQPPARIVLVDSDSTRADLIACALRDAGVPTRIVPLDVAATHWPLVRAFAPNIVLGDGAALKAEGQVWLQLFQADQALKRAKLVAVPLDRLCRMDLGIVNLRMLIPQIPQLSGELSKATHPTSAPALPRTSNPLPESGAPPEAPPPPLGDDDDDDDDDDEYERLTVARPMDIPLPEEASPSRTPEIPTVRPDAPVEAAPPKALLIDLIPPDEPLRGPRPILDSLAPPKIIPSEAQAEPTPAATPPSSDTHSTNRPLTTSEPKAKSGGGAKLLVAALFTVVGAGAGWLAFKGKIPGVPSLAQEAVPAAQEKTSKEAEPVADAQTENPVEEAVDPEVLLFRIDSVPSPDCETLVTNLDDLKPGGAQQAAVSLGKARQSIVLGQLDDALRLTCEAVLVHPESLALEELASLYLARRSPEQALKWYQKAAALRPDRPRTLELGGDINSQLGNVAEARTAFVQSLKVKPDDQKTLDAVAKQFVDEGNVQLRSGAFSKAELLFRKAITLSGENQDAAGGLAATYAGTGNVESARRWATRTLSLDEGHHVALIVMAALATETGDEEQAIALIDRALKRSPHYAPAHQLLHKLRPTKAAPVARALPATQEQPSSSPAAEQPAAAQPATPPATATPPTGNQPAAEQPTAP